MSGRGRPWPEPYAGDRGPGLAKSDHPGGCHRRARGAGLMAAGAAALVAAAPAAALVAAAPVAYAGTGAGGRPAAVTTTHPVFTGSTLVARQAGLSHVTAVATGDGFFLALLANGTVMAWGQNNVGQLGDGTTTNSAKPVQVKGLSGVKAIAAGAAHSLALLTNGTLMAWGDDQAGQLGNGTFELDSDVPVAVTGLTGVARISAGLAHNLALLTNGTVMAWGLNNQGQLGTGTSGNGDLPEPVRNLTGVTAVAAGSEHSLALLRGGTVMAWGSNSAGQLGNNDIEVANSTVPEKVKKLASVTAIAAGQNYCLALLANGTAVGWGDDESGQLGNGLNPPFYALPVKVRSLTTATALSAGDPLDANPISLALLSSHTVAAWGATPGLNEIPRAIKGVTGVIAISPGLFLLSNGTVETYRPGRAGALPRQALRRLAAGRDAAGAAPAAAVDRRAGPATGPSVLAWGDNSCGELATGGRMSKDVPAPAKGLAGAVAVSAGGCYGLALMADGTVRAWGYNSSGQLGDGTTTERLLPVTVPGLSGVTQVSAGAFTSLALLANGTVMSWGDNISGELGNGSTAQQSDVPVQVSGITTAKAVFAGDDFCFALLSDGTVMAWGDNSAGELGIGSTAQQSNVPVAIPGLSGVTTMAAGTLHALAVLGNGTVMSWGSDLSGELGTGEHGASESDVPVRVQGIHTAVGVAAGYEHSEAVLANGTVMSWGSNQFGQLGIATRNFYASDDPIQVFRVTGAISVGAGDTLGAALLKNGAATAWGSDSVGELGNGETGIPEIPAPVRVSGLTTATQLSVGGVHVFALASG